MNNLLIMDVGKTYKIEIVTGAFVIGMLESVVIDMDDMAKSSMLIGDEREGDYYHVDFVAIVNVEELP